MKNILILDNDSTFFDLIKKQLNYSDEFNLVFISNLEDVFEILEKQKISLILCDIAFSASGGIELCKILHNRSIHIPFIIISEKSNDSDIILSLHSGANDFIDKFEKINIIPAKIRRMIDDYEYFSEQEISFGNWIYSPKNRMFKDFKYGTKIKLTEKEAGIIKFLRSSPDKSASRNDILSKVWGYHDDITTHTLETHIYRLRKKISKNDGRNKIIKTIPGGYMLDL